MGIEALLTSALGFVAPWEVEKVDLDTARRRIDFEVRCPAGVSAVRHRLAADSSSASAPVGDAAQAIWLERNASQCHALVATGEPQEREGLAAEDGIARGVRAGAVTQRCRSGCGRSQALDLLGSAKSLGAIQAHRRGADGPLRLGKLVHLPKSPFASAMPRTSRA